MNRLLAALTLFLFAIIPCVAIAQPSSWDWRNVGGVNYVTPAKDSGECGSCYAFATVGALESQVLIHLGLSSIDLSEQTMVSCSSFGNCTYGSPLVPASSFLYNVGVPTETCFPYTSGAAGVVPPCSNACSGWQNQTYKIVDYLPIDYTVSAIKNAIYTYGPVVATIDLWSDLWNFTGGIYYYNYLGNNPTYISGHNVLVVGYNDTGQYFICKNNRGPTWAESGYFRIAYSEVGGTTNFGAQTLAYTGAVPYINITIPNPPSNLRIIP